MARFRKISRIRLVQSIAIFTLMVIAAGKKDKAQPNIVMIVADDLGWDDVSFHGSSQIPTPHIDKLANEGVILNGYYVSPICTPSRASFMTGKHPVNLGIQHSTIFGTQPYGLPLGEITTPQYMRSLGYKTHGIGKWHLGFFEKEYTPTYRGFDSYYGFWNGKEDYWDHSSQEDVWGNDLRNNEEPVKNESGHYGTELFAQRAVQVIQTHNQSKPLYLYLAQQAVHSANGREPLQAPDKLVKSFTSIQDEQRRIYAGMVTSLDISVGKVYDALKESGMLDNTVLVFTTDNGGAPRGFNWNQGCNYPLKGGKDSFWEGGVRAVGFVHSNLLKKKGRVSTEMIDATDWLPTFYHLGGGDVNQIQETIDGMNVWDTISEEKPSPRTEILHNIDPIRKFAAIRVNNYKLIVNQDAVYKQTWHPRYVEDQQMKKAEMQTIPGAVVDCGQWSESKGNKCDTSAFPCLFDISNDPCEYNSIANENMQIVHQLLERLIQIQEQVRPVWFPKRDPRANPALFNGFWGPWRENPANGQILKDMEAKIPKPGLPVKKSRGNYRNQTGVYQGHEEFHSMLHKILKHTKKIVKNKDKQSKKAKILQNENSRIKHSEIMLFKAMEEKTHDKQGNKIVGKISKKDTKDGHAEKASNVEKEPRDQHTKENAQNIHVVLKREVNEVAPNRNEVNAKEEIIGQNEKENMHRRNILIVKKREISEPAQQGTTANEKRPTLRKESLSKRSRVDSRDDTVTAIVRQSIENNQDLGGEGTDDSAFSYIIQDLQKDSDKKEKTVNYKRSEIPKVKKAKKDEILKALAKLLI